MSPLITTLTIKFRLNPWEAMKPFENLNIVNFRMKKHFTWIFHRTQRPKISSVLLSDSDQKDDICFTGYFTLYDLFLF